MEPIITRCESLIIALSAAKKSGNKKSEIKDIINNYLSKAYKQGVIDERCARNRKGSYVEPEYKD